MKIAGDWLERGETQRVLALLTDAGHQAYAVGGCVRNALLGQPVADIDISTDARPETVTRLAEATGLRAVPTGIEHGTVTVICGGVPYEITTFRRDIETFGRHAVVAFSNRIEDDAQRRDFTMNALYATAAGALVDPLAGLPDLRARRVRFVGDAEARIREDYLRILRFFRFHAWYGDPERGLDPDGLAACTRLAEGIVTLSKERIGAEMGKLLAAADPAPSLIAMERAGVLPRALPGAQARALPALVGLEGGAARNWLCRLAALGGDDPAEALRLSRSAARQLDLYRAELPRTTGAGELGYRHGAALALDIGLVRAARAGAPLPPSWAAEAQQGAQAVFPLKAADLMPGLEGAALGARLKALEARWIASGFTLGREALLG